MSESPALSVWSQFALGAYYYATLPDRKRRCAERVESGQAPIMVLFYHRVANHHANDWTMSEVHFSKQLSWLRDHFDVVSLETAQRRVADGSNTEPSVAITFDDGYADNCSFALPLLIRDRIPFTYFVASQHILTGEPFPHDVKAGQPLPVNTVDQLQALVDAGVEIGSHTRTHADLGAESDLDRLYAEVIGCRSELVDAIGCPIRYFAFPYGLHENLNAEVFRMARQEGYLGACSAYGGYNFPGDDPFHLQRIHADPELIRLKNWLMVDPRKETRVIRFQYDADVPATECRLSGANCE